VKRVAPALAAAAILLVAVAGCSRDSSLACDRGDARILTADSIPPVRIPDGLTPPDESESLRLPPAPPGTTRAAPNPCLETPPPFFEERAPDLQERAPASDDRAPSL